MLWPGAHHEFAKLQAVFRFDRRSRRPAAAVYTVLGLNWPNVGNVCTAVAKEIRDAPSKIMSRPMAKPRNQTLETGSEVSSIIPRTNERIPENVAHPQRGNLNIAAPIARNNPPTTKRD